MINNLHFLQGKQLKQESIYLQWESLKIQKER